MKPRQKGTSIYKPVSRAKQSSHANERVRCTLEVFTRKLGALI
jgi:hypothetical protein